MLKRVKNGHCPQNNANSISNITVLTHDTQTHDLTVDQATRLRKDESISSEECHSALE